MSYYDGWAPYVSVAERRRKAARAMEKLRKQGHPVAPVLIEGRAIARTFWGKAWCENLERYSDYANRLPRGRTYLRNGSVLDLQIAPGLVEARVSGSHIYQVEIRVKPVPGPKWKALCADCGGAIASLVELLQGRFSKSVMERLCRQGEGLFPTPKEIALFCSCPDGATMCKHVAATLYGIGARLDAEPGLLFQLRGVDGADLLAQAATGLALSPTTPTNGRALEGEDLADLFGLDLGTPPPAPAQTRPHASKQPEGRASKQPGARTSKPSAGGAPRAASSRAASGPRARRGGRALPGHHVGEPEGMPGMHGIRGHEATGRSPFVQVRAAGTGKPKTPKPEAPPAMPANPKATLPKPAKPKPEQPRTTKAVGTKAPVAKATKAKAVAKATQARAPKPPPAKAQTTVKAKPPAKTKTTVKAKPNVKPKAKAKA